MTDLPIGPDVFHGNGHFTWPPILARPEIRFAWAKASQGATFQDDECRYNLASFKAGADRGDIDWFGAYIWPSMAGAQSQVDLYLKVVAGFSDDPRFRWVIDVEGGSVPILNSIAAGLSKALGKQRGALYGGSYLINVLKNPTPAQCPAAAALPTFFRAGYVNDPPGQGINRIPALYAGKGPQFWQYTNGVWGPNDQTRFPRQVPGRGHGDFSAFWQPTGKQTYAEWLKATTPGAPPPPPPPGGDDDLTPEQEKQLTDASHAGIVALQEAKHHGIDTTAGKPWADQLARVRAKAARVALGVPTTTPTTPTPIPTDVP